MNARELLNKFKAKILTVADLLANQDEFRAALRLLAAAEANDGTTPETDILIEAVGLDPTCPNAEYFRRIERERNGLAARVGELERLVEIARNDMDSMRKRHADEMARYGCPFVNSVVSREDGHFIAHQIIETHPTPNGLTVVIADAARGSKP